MSNREIMLNALKKTVIKELKDRGFTGTYPHFKKIVSDCIELIDFQTNKYGGSFTIEVSAVFPNNKVTNLSDLNATVDSCKVDVSCANQRCRLKGMFDGWFYYRDIYKLPNGFYHDVSEKESDSFSPPKDWKLLQVFDEKTADEISEEISVQLDEAFEWLFKFEQKSRKKNKGKLESTSSEEKHPFYMHGVVAKNKKTIYLMDKYCPKKH